jgi:hypothetical protein
MAFERTLPDPGDVGSVKRRTGGRGIRSGPLDGAFVRPKV